MGAVGGSYGSIKVKCKNCGKEYPSESFVLDHVYRMMVCPQCVKDRQKRDIVHKEAKQMAEAAKAEPEEKKPAGWDADDELLEKAYADKQAKKGLMVDMGGGKVKRKCFKCQYDFVYNKLSKTPNRCPYCNAEIFD